MSSSDSCDVAIFGGGFGGLYTALAIAQQARQSGKKQLDVVLVEPTDKFVFLPLLYDLTVGTATESEVCPAYSDILEGTGVRHIRASLDELLPLDGNNKQQQATICSAGTMESVSSNLSFRAAVAAVGASPEAILKSVPGATKCAQPFYTAQDARNTGLLLDRMENIIVRNKIPSVAVVGGGYGGVELAASVKRKIPQANVSLLARSAPMGGTRAETLIDRALQRLGVTVDICSVEGIQAVENVEDGTRQADQYRIQRSGEDRDAIADEQALFDGVLWTAGSAPAYPVSNDLDGLVKSNSGRLATDSTLRCIWDSASTGKPMIWALGDCSEIVPVSDGQAAVPRTAQAAMQQSDIVAFNILTQLKSNGAPEKVFKFQDLGSMLTLGGPNAALLAPTDGAFAPIFGPLLDTLGSVLQTADDVLREVSKNPIAEELGISSTIETLGLSLGGYGLGVDAGAAPGTLAGTLTGATRRAVYAARMPTNKQRVVAVASAAVSTATSLAKEAKEVSKQRKENKEN